MVEITFCVLWLTPAAQKFVCRLLFLEENHNVILQKI